MVVVVSVATDGSRCLLGLLLLFGPFVVRQVIAPVVAVAGFFYFVFAELIYKYQVRQECGRAVCILRMRRFLKARYSTAFFCLML